MNVICYNCAHPIPTGTYHQAITRRQGKEKAGTCKTLNQRTRRPE